MHQTFLTNVQVPGPSPAAPIVGLALGDAVLKPVEARMVSVPQFLYLLKNTLLSVGQRLESAIVIVYDADSTGKTQSDCSTRDGQRIFRFLYAAANYRIDVDVKVSVLCQVTKFLIQYAQAFARHFVGVNIVDA